MKGRVLWCVVALFVASCSGAGEANPESTSTSAAGTSTSSTRNQVTVAPGFTVTASNGEGLVTEVVVNVLPPEGVAAIGAVVSVEPSDGALDGIVEFRLDLTGRPELAETVEALE